MDAVARLGLEARSNESLPVPPARIADVARELGTTPRTLRYWESQGLLTSSRSLRRERVYTSAEREQARLIHTLRELGMPVDEVRDLLTTSAGDGVARVRAFLKARIKAVREDLERLELALGALDAA